MSTTTKARALTAALLLAGCSHGGSPAPAAPSDVLIFSKTSGFRHASIPVGITAVTTIATNLGLSVSSSEDASVFSAQGLDSVRVVVFLNTTGDVLAADQELALQDFIRAGGAFVGVHSATDTEPTWPWYRMLVGAYFAGHPAIQQATLEVQDATHPSTESLPASWTRTDEWYNFDAVPDPGVSILMTIDETSYTGGAMGAPHPMAWHHTFEGGRSWYTPLGHTLASYSEPLFLEHLAGGLRWAAGLASASPPAVDIDLYEVFILQAGERHTTRELLIAPRQRGR
jgi:type 1 glutamine amidotransferase